MKKKKKKLLDSAYKIQMHWMEILALSKADSTVSNPVVQTSCTQVGHDETRTS